MREALPGYMLSFPQTGYCRIAAGKTEAEAISDAIAASDNLQQTCNLLLRANYAQVGQTARQQGDGFMSFEFRRAP